MLAGLVINSVYAHENLQFNLSVTKSAIAGDVLVYNLSNAKLHRPDCEWAEKCTKNCIYLDKKELKHMFFIPCMVCGGNIFEPVKEN